MLRKTTQLKAALISVASIAAPVAFANGAEGGHGFNWLQVVPGLEHVAHHVPMAILVASILVVTMAIARLQLNRALKSEGGGMVPDDRMTYRNFFEIIAEQLYGFVESVMGEHDAKKFFPVIGTLFVYIFTSNLFGLIPGFLPPTDNLNTTLALGAFVFIYYNYAGLRENGLGYIKHFFGPIWWLAPLLFVIEIASHIFRPLSLSLRLRGNIMGDHVVLGVFSDLVPYIVPVAFYGIGLFVAFVQALVFCLMTMAYISLGTAHDH